MKVCACVCERVCAVGTSVFTPCRELPDAWPPNSSSSSGALKSTCLCLFRISHRARGCVPGCPGVFALPCLRALISFCISLACTHELKCEGLALLQRCLRGVVIISFLAASIEPMQVPVTVMSCNFPSPAIDAAQYIFFFPLLAHQ